MAFPEDAVLDLLVWERVGGGTVAYREESSSGRSVQITSGASRRPDPPRAKNREEAD